MYKGDRVTVYYKGVWSAVIEDIVKQDDGYEVDLYIIRFDGFIAPPGLSLPEVVAVRKADLKVL